MHIIRHFVLSTHRPKILCSTPKLFQKWTWFSLLTQSLPISIQNNEKNNKITKSNNAIKVINIKWMDIIWWTNEITKIKDKIAFYNICSSPKNIFIASHWNSVHCSAAAVAAMHGRMYTIDSNLKSMMVRLHVQVCLEI